MTLGVDAPHHDKPVHPAHGLGGHFVVLHCVDHHDFDLASVLRERLSKECVEVIQRARDFEKSGSYRPDLARAQRSVLHVGAWTATGADPRFLAAPASCRRGWDKT